MPYLVTNAITTSSNLREIINSYVNPKNYPARLTKMGLEFFEKSPIFEMPNQWSYILESNNQTNISKTTVVEKGCVKVIDLNHGYKWLIPSNRTYMDYLEIVCRPTNEAIKKYYQNDFNNMTNGVLRRKINNDFIFNNFAKCPDIETKWKVLLRRMLIRKIIHSRCFSAIHIKGRNPLPPTNDIREQRARDTLRTVIGEVRWKNFIKNGFISIKAKSGRIYQIFSGGNMTRVYEKGVLIERLCVMLEGEFPPTDSLIVRYLLILNNENDFWNRAIKWGKNNPFNYPESQLVRQEKSEKSLIEIAKQLRKDECPAGIRVA